jgi:predicted Zn-dependent protease
MKHINLKNIALISLLFFVGFNSFKAYAQNKNNIIIIRDTEIEDILKTWSNPIIKAADLDPNAINFILIQNNDLNAFVAGGPNIFLYTGLLTHSEHPGEVLGVIAHELAHIRGGHLVKTRQAFENIAYESMIGTLIGIGAAIATGNGGVGAAIATGSQSSAQGRFFGFSRVQESSADQAALSYMEKAELNAKGLKNFMKKLENQELLPASQQSEYVRTHPLTRDRIDALDAGVKRSSWSDKPYPELWVEQHARIIAKLKGFITPERIAWDYDPKDQSIAATYASSIADYKQHNQKQALTKINTLLEAEKENPYFLELKGQMLADFGNVEDALIPYKKAIEIHPNAPLIRTAYAHALIESAGQTNKARLEEAIINLKRASRDEPRSARNHRLLATAYGRLGKEAMAKLHLSEESLLKGEYKYAEKQAKLALEKLEKGSHAWIRAQDILSFTSQKLNKEKG